MTTKRSVILTTAVAGILILASSTAMAATIAGLPSTSSGSMPWDRILGIVASALTGTTAKLLALVAFAVCGIGYMFSEGGGGVRKLFQIGIGISLVVGGSSLVSMLFSGGSGLTI